ncbi:hypothetical protein CC80DRAFT_431618 [Byssothecium circinans]|uniref:HIT-type domain-containing protein n=1 Tax=Byssothecium circinans TaxID=147558 RepID=A0A6A5T877_9PLEO|nr:hypothetical protein CC80DRAFT_431618 [Byssothecium circinans]
MAETLCGVCHTAQKKYKCPTCALPYCSIPCFKLHKPTHANETPTPAPTVPPEPDIPKPLPPKPLPKYLQSTRDFSLIATNPKYENLLKMHPSLLPTLQKVYAKTIEPYPEEVNRRGGYRGRGFGGRGRGRGRGGWHGNRDEVRKWTEKKGDADAMRLMKKIREGENGDDEMAALSEFVRLVQEVPTSKDMGNTGIRRGGDLHIV